MVLLVTEFSGICNPSRGLLKGLSIYVEFTPGELFCARGEIIQIRIQELLNSVP